jgi:hypothetical protein
MWACKHCKNSFKDLSPSQKGNHSRWCDKNPKRKIYLDKLDKSRNNISLESRKKINEGIKKAWELGKYDNADQGKGWRGKNHSNESKRKMSVSRKKFLREEYGI